MASITIIKELFESYKKWVIANPSLITDMETFAKWSSYLVAGKLNKSATVSELIYSLSNMFVLYNDTLILKSHAEYGQDQTKENLKYWMTVLHFSEVFVEMSARSRWGARGKWSAVALLQLVKCAANLVLVFRYRERPVQHPPLPELTRKRMAEAAPPPQEEGFRLRRSGRVLRRVENAPLVSLRSWKALNVDDYIRDGAKGGNQESQLIGETLYVLKPLLHLGSMAYFGTDTWKQWFFSLAMDLSSFSLYSEDIKHLNYEQRVEMSRRKLCLLYYLLRSPMYSKYSGSVINNFLRKTAQKVPFAGIICNPILRYISVWQDTYFYMWSN